jgi:hypothetical protein
LRWRSLCGGHGVPGMAPWCHHSNVTHGMSNISLRYSSKGKLTDILKKGQNVGWKLQERAEILVRSKYSFLIFVASGFALFSRAFLQFRVLLSTTDSLYGHYPNIIFGYRSLRGGVLPLWNPYLFAGTDFTTSMHNHMLDPFNWMLLLVPEGYIFHVLTAVLFIEICVVGILSFKIASRYLDDPWAAMLVALVAQLSEFPWFTTTTLVGTHLLAISLLSIYFIVTWEDRRKLTNYVLLSLCFFEIFMKGHVGYIAAFSLPIVAAFLLKTWPRGLTRPWRGLTPIVLAAAITSVIMSAARIVPIIGELVRDGAETGWFVQLFGANGYLSLTVLNPLIFGTTMSESSIILESVGVVGRHTQFHQLMYFGVVPFFMLILILRRNFGTPAFAAALLLLGVALTPIYLIAPLSDIINLLLFPFTHDIVPRTLTGFGVPFVLALALYGYSNEPLQADSAAIRGFVVVVGLVLCASLVLEIKVLDASGLLFTGLRISAFIVLFGAAAMAWRLPFDTANVRQISNCATLIFLATAIMVGIVGVNLRTFLHTYATLQAYIYSIGVALWIVGVIGVARISADADVWGNRHRAVWTIAGCFALAVALLVFPTPERSGDRPIEATMMAAGMGAATLLLLAAATLEIFVRYREGSLTRSMLLPVLALLTAGDLLFAVKDYEYVGAEPFVASDSLYPGSHRTLDERAETAAWRMAATLPNLLKNSELKTEGSGLLEWSFGGSDMALAAAGGDSGVVSAKNGAVGGGTVFQDVPLPAHPVAVSFGAWVRADKANVVRVSINGRSVDGTDVGSASVFHTGGGEWEWLTATGSSLNGLASARPHIVLDSPAVAAVYAPRLISGNVVTPTTRPTTGSIKTTPSVIGGEPFAPLNLKSYRVNNPWYETLPVYCCYTNVPMVYGVRTYGGVDSVVNADLIDFMSTFAKPDDAWYGRGGITEVLTNPRALDLLGVRYDAQDNGTVAVRPDALARLSAFDHYEVMPDRSAMLERLKNPGFDPTLTILLDRDPGWPAATSPTRFRPLEFDETNNNAVTLDLDLHRPTIVLFDDSYSAHWQARWNGRAIPVMLANGNFMAVAPPLGHGTLSFEFQPQPFLRLFKIGAVVTLLVLLLGAYVGITAWGRRPLRSAEVLTRDSP